jgi:uncharacterized protein
MPDAPAADSALVERLRTALSGVPGIRLAVLFGSAASGRLRRDSDVDIAILAAEAGRDGADELTLFQALSHTTTSDIDVVPLDTASTLLKWQVATKGIPLLQARPGEFGRFQARAASEYLDYAPALAHYGELFRRRLARGVSDR